jgi:hypothetical protein
MKVNSWLYHYYMVQSRLQFGLAYGAPTPGTAAQVIVYKPYRESGSRVDRTTGIKARTSGHSVQTVRWGGGGEGSRFGWHTVLPLQVK